MYKSKDHSRQPGYKFSDNPLKSRGKRRIKLELLCSRRAAENEAAISCWARRDGQDTRARRQALTSRRDTFKSAATRSSSGVDRHVSRIVRISPQTSHHRAQPILGCSKRTEVSQAGNVWSMVKYVQVHYRSPHLPHQAPPQYHLELVTCVNLSPAFF